MHSTAHTTVFGFCLLVAFICFLLDGFKVQAAVAWTPLGFAAVVGAFLFPLAFS